MNTVNLIDFMYGNQGVRDVMDSLGICPDVVAAGIRAVAGKLDELADVVLETL